MKVLQREVPPEIKPLNLFNTFRSPSIEKLYPLKLRTTKNKLLKHQVLFINFI